MVSETELTELTGVHPRVHEGDATLERRSSSSEKTLAPHAAHSGPPAPSASSIATAVRNTSINGLRLLVVFWFSAVWLYGVWCAAVPTFH